MMLSLFMLLFIFIYQTSSSTLSSKTQIRKFNALSSTTMTGQEAAGKGINNQETKNAAANSDAAIQKPLRGWQLFGVLFR